MYSVIMAGGAGTRFWPSSRKSRPKQFLNITGGNPLILDTCDRLASLVRDEDMMPRGGRARIWKPDPLFPLAAGTPARARVGGPHAQHRTPITSNTHLSGPALDEVAPSHEVALRASQPPPAAASSPSLAPASLFAVARSTEALRSGGVPPGLQSLRATDSTRQRRPLNTRRRPGSGSPMSGGRIGESRSALHSRY